MKWFQEIFIRESTQWTVIRNVRRAQLPSGSTVTGDEFYVEIYLESFRLQRERVVATNFRGVVYAYMSLPRKGDSRAEMTSISSPGGLRQATEADLDRMVSVNTRVAGPVPWQGGPMSIELGVFSIRTGNLLAPFVDYVGEIASAVGVSATTTILPFLPLVSKGLELMAGQTADSKLAIGIDTDLETAAPITMAVVASPTGTYTESSVALDVDGRLTSGGMPIRESNVVFSVRRRPDNPEWAADAQLKAAWSDVRAAITAGRRPEAEEQLIAFKRIVWISSSLTNSHKSEVIAWAEEQFAKSFPGGGISSSGPDGPTPPDDLSSLVLGTSH